MNSACTSSLPVALLLFNFFAALSISSGVKDGIIIAGSTASGVTFEEKSSFKYLVMSYTCSPSDVTNRSCSSYVASGFFGFRESTFLMGWWCLVESFCDILFPSVLHLGVCLLALLVVSLVPLGLGFFLFAVLSFCPCLPFIPHRLSFFSVWSRDL